MQRKQPSCHVLRACRAVYACGYTSPSCPAAPVSKRCGWARADQGHEAVFFKTFCAHVSSCENVTDHSHGSRIPPSRVSRAPPLPGELALCTASTRDSSSRACLPTAQSPQFAQKKSEFLFSPTRFLSRLLVQKNLDIASFRGTNCRQFLGARGTVSRAGLDKQADGSAAPSP